MFQESDNDNDDIDDYIYSMLDDGQQQGIQEKMDTFQKAFIGSDGLYDTDETAALIQQLQQENALDAKYEQFAKKRDDDLEKRYLELKKDPPVSLQMAPPMINQEALYQSRLLLKICTMKWMIGAVSVYNMIWNIQLLLTQMQVFAMKMLPSNVKDAKMITSIVKNAISIPTKVNQQIMKPRSTRANDISVVNSGINLFHSFITIILDT